MALTRSDKFIIAGAITLALAVVLGLAIWKKPYLFTGGAPETPKTAQNAPATQEAAPIGEGQADGRVAAAPKPEEASATAAPAIPEPPSAPAAPAAPGAQAAAPAPSPAEATGTVPAALPDQAAAPSPESESTQGRILFKGDETLDDMFSEMAKPVEPAPGAKTPQPKDKPAKALDEAAPKTGETSAAPAPEEKKPAPDAGATAPQTPAKETAPAMAKADSLDAPKKKAPAKKTAPKSAPVRGRVMSVSTAAGPGEFTVTVKTSAPVAGYQKFFMDNPPRIVVDLDGVWRYSGPWTLAGKGPLAQSVRLGKHPDKFRLVLDLAPDAETRLRAAPEATRVQNGLIIKIR